MGAAADRCQGRHLEPRHPGRPQGGPVQFLHGQSLCAEVKNAFAAWAKATGITFKEVADSASADIRVGFGDFDTAKSGVAGYTSFRDKNGAIQAGAVIRVEDPSQDPLVHGASGGLHYSKSGINLQQLLEHEIGHAIGFANNADPNSIMYYMGSDTLHGLDAADKQAAKSLYQSSVANDSARHRPWEWQHGQRQSRTGTRRLRAGCRIAQFVRA